MSRIRLGGAPEGFDATLLIKEAQKNAAPLLHIARDDKRMAAMADALAFFAPDMPVMSFSAWDCLPYDRVSPSADVSSARMAFLARLCDGISGPQIILTTLNAAMQRVPDRDTLAQASFSAALGRQINETHLREFLVRMGYQQPPTVTDPGDYALRGGIIDIFPPGFGRAAPV